MSPGWTRHRSSNGLEYGTGTRGEPRRMGAAFMLGESHFSDQMHAQQHTAHRGRHDHGHRDRRDSNALRAKEGFQAQVLPGNAALRAHVLAQGAMTRIGLSGSRQTG